MNKLYFRSLLLLLYLVLFARCNPVSKLSKNEYLLVRNSIRIEKESKLMISRKQLKEDYDAMTGLNDYVQQKPNTKLLGLFKFHLAMYNYSTRKERKKKSAGIVTPEAESEGVITKRTAGEAPSVLDSNQVEKSTIQMHRYLYNKGYFNNWVKDSIVYKHYRRLDGGKARVHYYVRLGPRYTIEKFSTQIDDKGIAAILAQDGEAFNLRTGAYYDESNLDKERDKVMHKLKNNGYFFFSKEYIRFVADTSLGQHGISLTMHIDPVKKKEGKIPENQEHQRYVIGNIYIQPDFYPDRKAYTLDTVTYGGYNFLINPEENTLKTDRNAYIRFKTIARKVFIKKGEFYSLDNYDNTYLHLAGLKIFKFINIQFERSETEGELTCMIQLNPVPRHLVQIEAEGTHSSGNLGVAENIIYLNKNIFRGAERFEANIKGALEVQKQLTGKNKSIDELGLFNTAEAGPELKVDFPKLLFPIKEEKIPKRYNPKSSLHMSYNYQLRPEYIRWIWEGGLSYTWKESPRKTHILAPVNVSSVKIKDGSAIKDSNITNDFLRNSFTDHFVSGSKYSFIYSNQTLNKKIDFTYFRADAEVAGNSLLAASSMTNVETDSVTGQYNIFGIQYAQYAKADIDVRRYNFINKHSTLVFRFAAGWGIAYGNSEVMPFEKSYFSGGANGLRAWQARNIGPGGNQKDVNYNQIGDIKLEGNIESRFEFFGPVEGAAFIDAGNIWLTRPDPERDSAQFGFNTFYKEIAFGGGFGIRLNYDYFIIRVDAAVQIKDPGRKEGERWVKPKDIFSKRNYNLGIGYPF